MPADQSYQRGEQGQDNCSFQGIARLGGRLMTGRVFHVEHLNSAGELEPVEEQCPA
jgi:hypothetical protein